MHLTRESEYALLAMAHLAESRPGARVSVAAMAEARRLPVPYLAKILQKLRRAGLVTGGRGRGQGYTLARPPARIAIGRVLEAVEPPANLDTCLLWQGYCGDANPCPLHHRLKPVHREIRDLLGDISLAEYLAEAGHQAMRHQAPPRKRRAKGGRATA